MTSPESAVAESTAIQLTATPIATHSTQGDAHPYGEEPALAAQAETTIPSSVVRLSNFEPPFTLPVQEHTDYARRFSTLFIHEAYTRSGSTSNVYLASNAFGEKFALKVRKAPDAKDPCEDSPEQLAFSEKLFAREFNTHRLVSDIKGFPELYGKGSVDGQPALIMEWIEGADLQRFAMYAAVDDAGRVSPLTAARLGRDLFDVLSRVAILQDEVIHGDLSLRNVLICTLHQTLEEQISDGHFALRLIDLSSSCTRKTATHFQPAATQEFAAPELTRKATVNDSHAVVSPERTVIQPSVDVYAAARIIAALLYGPKHDVYETAATAHCAENDLAAVLNHEPEVAVAVKMANADLASPATREGVFAAFQHIEQPLHETLKRCLAQNPKDRPSASAVRDALAAFCETYTVNIGRALRGEVIETPAPPARSGFFGSFSQSFHQFLRTAGKGIASAFLTMVVIATAFIVLLSNPTVTIWGFTVSGLATQAFSAVLLLPLLAGTVASGKRKYSIGGLIRATVTIFLATGVVAVIANAATFSPDSLQKLYVWALFGVCVASWCPFVLNCAFPPRTSGHVARRALPTKATRSS